MNSHQKALKVLEKVSKELKGKKFVRAFGVRKDPDKAKTYFVAIYLKCSPKKGDIPKKVEGVRIVAMFLGNLKQKKVPQLAHEVANEVAP